MGRPESQASPLTMTNLKNCLIIDLDSSKEGSWCTDCNPKNLSSLKSTVSEKRRKKKKKKTATKDIHLFKKIQFLPFSLDFFKNGSLPRAEFFFSRCIQCIKTLLLSYLNQKSNIFSDFYCKGGSLWFRTSHKPKIGQQSKIYNIVLNRINRIPLVLRGPFPGFWNRVDWKALVKDLSS